jgi:Domain of unknown function (DUF5130)
MPLRTSRTRRAVLRLGAVSLIASALVGVAGPASADTPESWPDAEPMSTLEALLVFVGVPAGLFALIALLVVAPSLARGPRYRPGMTWLARSEQFGAQPELPARTEADAADQQGSEAFTVDQRRSIDRAIDYAEKASELSYSVFVGGAHDRARAHAEHLHRGLPDPASSVLVLVDPATREVEIVVGAQAQARVDEQSAGLAVLAMQSAFSAGDLAGGIVAGLQLLGDHARRPASLHTDSP